MKKLSILFSLLLLTHWSLAQNYDVYVSGTVTDSLNNPAPGVAVYISMPTAIGTYSNTVTTDMVGEYFDTIAISGMVQGALELYIVNCHNDTVPGRGFFSPNSNVVVQDFNYCPSQGTGTGGGNGYSIEGMVMATGAMLANGRAYLITQDSSSSNPYLRAVDSVDVRQGYYIFTGLDTGDYYVKAAAPPNAMGSSLMPTYYGNELLWANATKISLHQDEKNINITLIAGSNPGGPGFIGGYVSQGANKKAGPGDPVEHVLVLLLTDQDAAVAYQYTDANGAYAFENIALGGYKLYVDVPGKMSYPQSIILDKDKLTVSDVNFAVNSTSVVSGLQEISEVVNAIYPNPVKDVITLSLDFNEHTEITTQILTVQGQVLMAKTVQANAGQLEMTLNMQLLPKGLYIIQLSDGKQTYHQKVLKQ